ncbi:hypothetical protein [Ornithinibacillus californiensis]|uniref:hypothetical protein n=1 Tax=Ornithinibacillus californiensis TaxID=161536 RepID=UPI00064E0908|nr:hypothetical protein [Ornithinibacillus californiensis]
MVPNYEKRHFFMAIGIGILFISPILLLLIPSFIVNSLYLEPGTWVVIAPSTSYWLYGIGCLLLSIACFIMYLFNVRKLPVFIGIILIIVGAFFLLIGTKPFIAVSDQGISIRESTSEINFYAWNEIDHINYYDIPRSEGFDTYEFHFQDGNSIQLAENGLLSSYRLHFFNIFQEENLTLHWK